MCYLVSPLPLAYGLALWNGRALAVAARSRVSADRGYMYNTYMPTGEGQSHQTLQQSNVTEVYFPFASIHYKAQLLFGFPSAIRGMCRHLQYVGSERVEWRRRVIR
jgi:hypothetical protein